MLWKWTFIYLIHSFWSLLCCVFFFVPRSKVQPLQHHTLLHRHTHNNHGHIPVILEAVQAHEHSVPLGCWGSPKSHMWAPLPTLACTVQVYLGFPTCSIQGNETKAVLSPCRPKLLSAPSCCATLALPDDRLLLQVTNLCDKSWRSWPQKQD